MCQSAKPQIEAEILAYLERHPDAQDTLEGVVEWWLLRQRIAAETAKVKETLDGLVARGLLSKARREDSRTYYKANSGTDCDD